MLPVFYLSERKILLIIFGKIQRLGLYRNALAGIIPESPAFSVNWFDALFRAEDGFLIQFHTMMAVAAAAADVLSEKHCFNLFRFFFLDYTSNGAGMLLLFSFFSS